MATKHTFKATADKARSPSGLSDQLAQYPLLAALQGRRSRRFGLGMEIPSGPFTFWPNHGQK
ncbi:MAG TPA: hypothetical protein PKD98_29585 [Anaerolineae bacterium]|nr:hypothetical protein [Anaerolineae bacterium]